MSRNRLLPAVPRSNAAPYSELIKARVDSMLAARLALQPSERAVGASVVVEAYGEHELGRTVQSQTLPQRWVGARRGERGLEACRAVVPWFDVLRVEIPQKSYSFLFDL